MGGLTVLRALAARLPNDLGAAGDALLRDPAFRRSAAGSFVARAVESSVHEVFIGLAVVGLVGLIVAVLMPRSGRALPAGA